VQRRLCAQVGCRAIVADVCVIARRDQEGAAAVAMAFAEEIELELTGRFDAASSLVEDAQ
jgi:hypothetical protein